MKAKRPVILLILDGWGIGTDDVHNAIFQANTPNIDHLLTTYPNGPIGAAGEHIGLAPGHQGSTEMGHLIMSAGRNVLLPQLQMKKALEGEIYTNKAYREAIRLTKERGSRLHLMGLLSDAGVHSYDKTCHMLMQMAAEEGIDADKVMIHIFSDGRDTPPTSLTDYIETLENVIEETGVGVIASVQGRYWVMDRDHRWERVEAAYTLLVEGTGIRTTPSIHKAIELARAENETDEFISPTVIHLDGRIQDNDVVINFNYRVDREIEITKALIEPEFTEFTRAVWPKNMHYVGTFQYYTEMDAPFAFERTELQMKNILPEVISAHGLTQYRLTETEKWVYVTKIFNAMREEAFDGETRHLIPSDNVATYDEKPAMQAVPIARDLVEQLAQQKHDFYLLNICNADILGHTGNAEAAKEGCEAIDEAIGLIYAEVQRQNAVLIITADHGDAEVMWDFDNDLPHTQHTDNFVPFILVDDERRYVKIRETGALRDVAATILETLGIEKPKEMDGSSLIVQ